ncbi:MAG TPA: hypothetical protein VFS60_04940, partial [Thermoanaerobaculia bacterium]|nr:hypothetical protein [Thermoanaerobaculia bacterium]
MASALVLAGAARAHELGAGRVEVFLSLDGGFRVDLQLDPDLTLQRLQLAAGEALTPGLADAPLREALLLRRDALLATASLTAAGAALPASFEYAPAPPAAGGRREAVVRLAGRLPAGATDLRLSWSLPSSRYALVVHREGETGDLETHWVEPGEAGPPLRRAAAAPSRLAVARQYLALGFTHILPGGLD